MAPKPNDQEGPIEPNDLPTPDYEQALSNLPDADLLAALDLALLELEKRLTYASSSSKSPPDCCT